MQIPRMWEVREPRRESLCFDALKSGSLFGDFGRRAHKAHKNQLVLRARA
jgi:hypothetical protein